MVVRAPARLDFGGGWTDVPPYSVELGGTVCSVAVARYATVRLSPRAVGSPAADATSRWPLVAAALRRAGLTGEQAPAVAITNEFPEGAGLGGSSAAGVALCSAIAAWRGEPPPGRAELAERSRALEVDELGIAGGRQDHYAAAFGGALLLRFGPGHGTSVRRLSLDARTTAALARRCVVAYTGEARVSATTITAVLDAYAAGETRVVTALAAMRVLAEQMGVALECGDLDRLGSLVGMHWEHQRALHPAIPTPRIDALLDTARRAGALGGKALGASGGGCVLAIASEGTDDRLRTALAADAELLDVTVDERGVSRLDG